MSEEYSEDYVLEEGGAATSRTFLILAGSLIGLFIIIAAFVLGFALVQRNEATEDRAIRLTENAEILAANALVTQTVIAMETEAAQPTETPVPTNTSAPTNTPEPTPAQTETPVVGTGAGESESAEAAATPDQTATAEAAAALATATPESAAEASGNGSTSLPDTGVETWLIGGVALALVAILALARKLRTG